MKRLNGLIGLAADIGLPTAAFYSARAASVPEQGALLVAAAVAVARVVWVAVRIRSVTWLAVLTLLGYGLGAVLTLVVGDPRILLLKESLTTTVFGVVFLVSARTAAPVTLSLAEVVAGGRDTELRHRAATDPWVRERFRSGSIGWGVGLLCDAVVRVPLVLALPIDTAVIASQVLLFTMLGVLGVWSWQRRVPLRVRVDPTSSSAEAP